MFDSPLAPEPTPWTVTGGTGQRLCLKIGADGFLHYATSYGPAPAPPCPPGWALPALN
jgi:hypothetical protein